MKNKITKFNFIKQFFFIAISALLFLIPDLSAQDLSPSVISAGGESFTADGYTLDFVIGELVTDTYSQQEKLLTQGFLQELSGITSIREPNINTAKIKIYPNPAKDILYIKIESGIQPSFYEIISIQGISIGKKQIENNITSVDVNSLKPGIYLLKFKFEEKSPVAISFIKN